MDTEKEKPTLENSPTSSSTNPLNVNAIKDDQTDPPVKDPSIDNPPLLSETSTELKESIPETPKKEIQNDQTGENPESAENDAENSKEEVEEKPKSADNADEEGVDKEVVKDQEEGEQEITDGDGEKKEPEEEPEPAPLPPPDLGQVSEEIDTYISTVSNVQPDDESTPPPEIPVCVEQFAVLVEAIIETYDSSDNRMKWSQLTDEDASTFLEATDRMLKLLNALYKFSSEEKYGESINRIGGVIQRGISYIEEEFRSLLEDHKVADPDNESKTKTPRANQDPDQDPVPEPEPTEETNYPGYPEEVVSQLTKLAKILFVGDHETECCQIYFIARRSALEKSLKELGFEKHSIDDLHKMSWENLEREIVTWNGLFKQCATITFPNERKLSDSIFQEYPSLSASMFSKLSRTFMIQFLNFYEAVAMTKRAAEKLFKFLDIYETLRDLLPKMESFFPTECMHEIKSEATLTRGRLGEATISIFSELENSIKADAAKTPVPGGAIHPLTRYTLNYLKYTCEYKDTLELVFREHQKIDRSDSGTSSDFENQSAQNNEQLKSPFQYQILKVMNLLDSNLEAKSKLYKEIPLSMIFLMNNGRYILQKIKSSAEISSLLGDTFTRKRSGDLRNYHKTYQRETWQKLLNTLVNHEGLNVNGKVVKPVLKERFKSFNSMFEEIHKTQCQWIISDEQLQSELRVSISNMVVPAYRSFMGRFSQTLTPGRQTEKYVKFQPEDVESYIDELFDGKTAPPVVKKGW